MRFLLPIAYGAAYTALVTLSSVYWFLPAGLRLAALWMSPRRDWWLLALGDMVAFLVIGEYRGTFETYPSLFAAAIVPWCV